MFYSRITTLSKLAFLFVLSILLVQTTSTSVDFHLVSKSKVHLGASETNLILISSLDESSDSLLRSVSFSSEASVQSLPDITSLCLSASFYSQLPKSTLYLILSLDQSKSFSVSRCSNQVFTAFMIEADPSLLSEALSVGQVLIRQNYLKQKSVVVFATSEHQRKLQGGNPPPPACKEFFFQTQNGTCEACSEGCSVCNNTDTCNECFKGTEVYYSYWKDAQVCKYCFWYECLTCLTADVCDICMPGYFKTPEGKCAKCSEDNCRECKNDAKVCETCQSGYFLNADTKCEYCSYACIECTSSDSCTNCKNGMFVNAAGLCEECPYQCNICTPNGCTECAPGFTIVDGKCKSCPWYCDTCNPTGACSQCMLGYFIDTDGYCVTCTDPYCEVCPDDQCTQCFNGTFFDISINKCSPCPANCDLCNGQGICLQCSTGPVIEGACLECGKYCKSCDSEECFECEEGYFKVQGERDCYQCDPGCGSCTKDQCNVCVNDFYEDLDTHKCVPCSAGCSFCYKFDYCEACYEGYFLTSDPNSPQVYYCASCIPNCLKCGDHSSCEVCEEGFTVNDQGKCDSCGKGCGECEAGTCKSCIEGFYFSQDYSLCISCSYECKFCLDFDDCQQCNDGYFVNTENGFCNECLNGCKVCDETSCFKCHEGLFSDKDGSCSYCSYGCNSCIDGESCNNCYYGFYLNQDEKKCFECMPFCQQCRELNHCDACYSGFFYKEGKCIQCQEGCAECDSNGDCVNCYQGTYLEDGLCLKCLENCVKCQNKASCEYCNYTYYLDPTTETCQSCFPNCDECQDSSTCFRCAMSFYFAQIQSASGQSQDTCIKCMENCQDCSETECYYCKNGYYLEKDGTCASCQDHCEYCFKDQNNELICYWCEYGYGMNGGNCEECPDNCYECKEGNCNKCEEGFFIDEYGKCSECDSHCIYCGGPLNCWTCEDGYEVNWGTGLCSGCKQNCLSCDSTKFCIQCDDYYYANDKGDCLNCPYFCKSCTEDVCIECESGLYIDTYGECAYCSTGCSSCESSQICYECAEGYYLYEKGASVICLSCGRGCLSCDEEKCIYCGDGYYLQNDECFECSRKFPGCYYCSDDTACQECDSGLKLSADGMKCNPCHEGCLYCYDDEQANEICYYCNTTYGLVDNKCVKCGDGCQSCLSQDECVSCFDYFYLDDAGRCRKCIDGCVYCWNSYSCDICEPGTFWNEKKKSCVSCGVGCSDCMDGVCISCEYGMFLDEKKKACTYCSPNCDECNSLDFCLTCSWSFYFNEEESKCLPCAENCYDCSSEDKCINCYEGFASISGKCKSCTANCMSCDDQGCSICYDGLYLTDLGTCEKCGENCLYCSSSSCYACYSRFYLDSSTFKCVKCATDNCLYCDDTSCYMCDYGFAFIDNQCVQCPENCNYCESADTCMKCYEGFFADSDGVCTPCSDKGCYWCNSDDKCEQCYYGYALDYYEGRCVTCPDFCEECGTDGSCFKCQEGAFPDQKTGKCFMCPDYCAKCLDYNHCIECASNYIQNIDGTCSVCMRDCLECESQDVCLSCDYGSYLDEESKCKRCDFGCFDCSEFSTCNECDYGFFLSEGKCKFCTDLNCLTCDDDFCTECHDGYFADEENGVCVPCIENCMDCSDNEECYQCFERFFIDEETGKCSKCAQNCILCYDSKDCDECEAGFVLNEDSSPRKCRKCPNNCEECTLTECLKCNIGFFLNEVGKCISCGNNCADCQMKGVCNQCMEGFYLDSSATCKNCANNCGKCKNKETCDECLKGYLLDQDLSCSGCPKGCTVCDDYKNCTSCADGFTLENSKCSKCSIPSVIKAQISSSYTSMFIDFVSVIDIKPISCSSAVSTQDSFGTKWNCTAKDKTLLINFDKDYQLSDSSVIYVSTDALFVKPCSVGAVLNFTAKFQAAPPAPKGQLKGTPQTSLACSEGALEYILDGVGGTAGMLPKIKWSAKVDPADESINTYVSALEGTRISIPTTIFKKVDSVLTVTAEIISPMKKSAFTSYKTVLIGEKQMTVLIDAGTELNYTTSKDYSFTAKVDNMCGSQESILFTWNLTYTTNPNFVLGLVPTVVPHRLRLEANTLEPFYFYVYTVTAASGSLSGTASIKIYGLAEDLVVVFDRKSGNISPLMDLVIDASSSYDPNLLATELDYTWTCLNPETNKSCVGADGDTLVSGEKGSVLNIPATRLPAGKSIQIYLTLRSMIDSRSIEESVKLYVYEGLSTNIQMTFTDKKVERSYNLYLDTYITSQAEYTLQWSQVQGSAVDLVPDNMPSLTFSPKTFNEGETYEFLLTATETLTGAFATASVEFKVNVPASCLNSLSISSEQGVALTDVFTLSIDSCSDGDEEDTPLTYTFFIIPTDFSGVFITKPQQFSSVDFMIFEGSFFAGVRVCDQLWGCTWKFLETFFYVSEYAGRRLADDAVAVYKDLVSSSSDATVLYAISVVNTFEMTSDEIDYVYKDSQDFISTEDVDLDTVEMMVKLIMQIVMNQESTLTKERIQEYFDDIVTLVNNSTEEISSDVMDSMRDLTVLIVDFGAGSVEYVNMVNDFLDQIFQVYAKDTLPGNVIANYKSDDMIYYKFREVSSNYKDKTMSLDGDVTVTIESLPFEDTDLVDINIKTFPAAAEYSDMLEITFTKCGTYINKVLTKTTEEVVPLTTPTVLFQLPRHKNSTGTWTCQYYTGNTWKADGCEFVQETDGLVQMRISHTSLFRLYDSDLVSSSGDGSSRHYGPVILVGLLTLLLIVGYTVLKFVDKNEAKKHNKVVDVVHEKKSSDLFDKVSGKDNDVTVIETSSQGKTSLLSYHLVLGLFTYDPRFTKSDRILAICLILATQFTIEGALIGYTAIDVEWVSTMVAVAVIAVVLTIPLHIVANLNLRYVSKRLCKAATVIAFVGFMANVALTVAIAVELTGRHSTWIISFFWGLLFESILGGLFMVARLMISKA